MTTSLKPVPADFGRSVITAAVYHWHCDNVARTLFIAKSLRRHVACDWGDLDDDDRKLNDEAVATRDGSRLHSSYNLPPELKGDAPDGKVWIITDGFGNDPSDPDQCRTTLLFPSDY